MNQNFRTCINDYGHTRRKGWRESLAEAGRRFLPALAWLALGAAAAWMVKR